MDHRIHRIAHVDEPAEPAEAEHHQRQRDGEDHRLLPRQCADPPQEPTAAAGAPGYFQARAYREDGQQGRQGDKEREKALEEFKAATDLGVGEQMVHPDRDSEKTRSMMKVSRPIVSL